MKDFHTYDAFELEHPNNALVSFLYHDMPAREALALADRIDADPDTRSAFDELLMAKLQFPKALFNPAPETLNNILKYSARTAVEAQL